MIQATVILSLVLLLSLPAAPWMCSTVQCPTGSSNIFVSGSFNIAAYGNCFIHDAVTFRSISHARCAAICSSRGCAHAILGSEDCLLMGFGVVPIANPKLFQKTSPPSGVEYEVAGGKSVTASSVNTGMPVAFEIGADRITDGDVSLGNLRMYHSKDGDMNPYIVIDLGRPYAIHKIHFWPRQNNNITYQRTKEITMYLGNTEQASGQFDSYDEAYYYAGGFGNEVNGGSGFVTIDVNPVRCGRYFAAKKEGDYDSAIGNEILEIVELKLFTKDP